MSKQFWVCVIGPVESDKLPMGADSPPRQAAQAAVAKMTGEWPEHCWSGWGHTMESLPKELGEYGQGVVGLINRQNAPPPTIDTIVRSWRQSYLPLYLKDAAASIERNSHMNKLTEPVSYAIIEEVLGRFINHCETYAGSLTSVSSIAVLTHLTSCAQIMKLRTEQEKAVVVDFINFG